VSRELGVGIANGASVEDFHVCTSNGLYPAVMELKGSEASILPALAQAAVMATNFCMGLLAKGVPTDKCVVAVVACTGINMCFGVTYLLDVTFPTFLPISGILDLTCEAGRRAATAYLQKVLQHCLSLGEVELRPVRVSEMALNTGKYFIKTITRGVFERGFKLFTSADSFSLHEGLDHMICCLNRLYHSEARDVAEYPLSLRTPDTDNSNDTNGCFDLIYRSLTAPELGFCVGTPNRLNDGHLYNQFVEELHRVITSVHVAGVLHVDLFASNVMWRLSSERLVEIKLIDWDAAHCLYEGAFSTRALDKLTQGVNGYCQPDFSEEHDLRYLKVYDLPFTEEYKDCWTDLSCGSKVRIDQAFWTLMHTTPEFCQTSNI
jgi:hypothetical protein